MPWGEPTPGRGWVPHSFVESYYMKVTGGGDRVSFYHEDFEEGAKKPKKERRLFGITISGRVARNAQGKEMRGIVGEINRKIIEQDSWRREQGGGQIVRGGYGQATDWAPGPPAGFQDVPQIFGASGGYYDNNGMWRDQ